MFLTGGRLDLGIRYSTVLTDDIHSGRWISHGGVDHGASMADVPPQATRMAKTAFRSYHQA